MISSTRHGYERADERLNLNKKAFDRLIQKVIKYGIHHTELKGNLRSYVDSMFFRHKIKEVIIYGEHLYSFSHDNKVTTVFLLPLMYRRYLSKLKKTLK